MSLRSRGLARPRAATVQQSGWSPCTGCPTGRRVAEQDARVDATISVMLVGTAGGGGCHGWQGPLRRSIAMPQNCRLQVNTNNPAILPERTST